MAAAQDELASLERVLTRLALTDDDKLQPILDKLLPLVIGKLENASQPVQQKVLSILSHVNKRMQAQPDVTLPIEVLATMYATSTNPLVRNFALVYTERGAERALTEHRLSIVPTLLSGVASRPAAQQAILLRLSAAGFEHLHNQTALPTPAEAEDFAANYAFLSNDGDRKIFLNFALRFLLYVAPSTRGPSSALQAAQQQQQQQNALNALPQQLQQAAAAAVPPPPPGLSHDDVAAIEGKTPFSDPKTLQNRKLGLLNFSALAAIPPSQVLPLYLAAASDPTDVISRRGEELLKKRCAVDAHRPPVDIETSEIIEPLFVLFHGSLDDDSVAVAARKAPAGPALRSRLLSLFCKSTAAANTSPWAMMTVSTCLFGSGATPRVQQQGMEFAVWMFKHAEPAVLLPAASIVIENCLSLLDTSSAASGQDITAIALRSFGYQAIGQLAQRLPSALRGRTDLAARCFSALATEPAGVRAAVAEATSALAAVFAQRDAATDAELLQLLENSIKQHQEAVRGAAIQWAIRLFPFDHVQARYMCIVGTADVRGQLATAAAEGLDPGQVLKKQRNTEKSSSSSSSGGVNHDVGLKYPRMHTMLEYICSRHPVLRSPVEEGRRLAMASKAFASAIQFLEACRKADESIGGGAVEDGRADIAAYFVLVENALVREAPGDLHAVALQALLSTSAKYRSSFTSAYSCRPSLFERLLRHVDGGARDAAGRLLGTLCSGMSAEQVQRLVESTANVVQSACTADGKKKVRFEDADGATAALGYIAAQIISGTPAVPSAVLEKALETLTMELDSSSETTDAALRGTAAVALGCAALPFGGEQSNTQQIATTTPSPCIMLTSLKDAPALAASMATLLKDKDQKVAIKAAQGLGFLAYGHRSKSVLEPVVTALLDMKSCKVESVSFAVGEALCLAFGGVTATADDMLHTNFTSLADLATSTAAASAIDTKKMEMDEAVPMEEDHAAAPTPSEKESETKKKKELLIEPRSPEEGEIQRKILTSLLEECICHSRSEVRCCGSIWLVSLLLFNGTTAAVHAVLARAQDSLSALLGDESELTQEMASRGLAAAYELADETTRAALVESLVGVLSGAAGRKRRAGDLTGDTQVFESGTIGTAPGGGSLSTYKEICSLANELGQPDLVYRFMQLANHQASINASRGAAFGFASVARLAGDALTPHVAKLVPRLYRSLYDPQPKVRDAMNHIWMALVDDPRAALTLHFDAVSAGLIVDMTGQQWRAREAAALAAADLIQGRRWDEVRPHFQDFWHAAFRTMDDVKESVRQAGLTLVRCVRGLTLRLTDRELTPASQGKEAVAVALPLLIQKGLPSQVPEVQALAVDTLSKIIKAAGPEIVKPHLNVVVPALIESLSGLEDSRLNYVEQHAERLGVDAGKLESARVAAAQGGAVGETLDSCARQLDGEALAALAPALSALIRRGVGLNTRAGAGRFVAQVVRRLGSESAPAAPQLMRALQEACGAERSQAVCRAYASANALLTKYAAVSRVDKNVALWLNVYGSDDSTADESSRAVSGLLLRALAREAPEIFARYAAEVAPVAYMAQYDSEVSAAAVWAEVWEESTTSVGAGLRLHAAAVLEKVQEALRSSQWGRKKAAAAAAAKACSAGGDAVAPYAPQLMAALLAELPGRLWEGKEGVLMAIGAAVEACGGALKSADGGLPSRVGAALLEAVDKKKSVYRKEALIQLKKVISVWGSEEDYLPTVSPVLITLASEFVSAASTSSSSAVAVNGISRDCAAAADAAAEKTAALVPISDVMACLGALWSTSVNIITDEKWILDAVSTAAAVIGAAAKTADVSAAVDAALLLARRCDDGSAAVAMDSTYSGIHLDPGALEVQSLLQAAWKVTEEGKSAQLREDGAALLRSLLDQTWDGMSDVDRLKWKGIVEEVLNREKVPTVKSAVATILASLV